MYSKTIKVRIYSCDFTAQTHRGDPAGKEFSTRSAPQMMHFTELYNHQGALRRRCATVRGMRRSPSLVDSASLELYYYCILYTVSSLSCRYSYSTQINERGNDVSDNPEPSRLRFINAGIFSVARRHVSASIPDIRRMLAVRSGYALEVLIVVCWAIFVTRPYLDFTITTQPAGVEYPAAIQSFYFWRNLIQCGPCALWNGAVNGGAPALADPYGAVAHPLVGAMTLLFGVPVGTKLVLTGTFIMAGIAQWLLAYELQTGRIVRIWSAALAVVGGHLAGRFQCGNLGLVLSTAACALAIPLIIRFMRNSNKRNAVLLGSAIASILLAGQGYYQIAFICVIASAAILLPADRTRWKTIGYHALLAAGIAFLLAAPLLIPLGVVLGAFTKDVDFGFASSQPIELLALNLLINDGGFYFNETLQKQPYPYLYINYIGWIPVLLAGIGLTHTGPPGNRRVILFLAAIAFLALWLASAAPLRLLLVLISDPELRGQIGGLRNIVTVNGLAVPPILGLAAIGLERLINAPWPRFQILGGNADDHLFVFNTRWLLALPVIIAVMSAYTYNKTWIATIPIDPVVIRVVDALDYSPHLHWVNHPFGEVGFLEYAVRKNLKISAGFRPWNLKERPPVEPEVAAFRDASPEGWRVMAVVEGIIIAAAPPGNEYAAVDDARGRRSVCTATGLGGDIRVTCDTPGGGTLRVREYAWPGWQARVNGAPAPFLDGPWLSVAIPPGVAEVTLRYRLWDAPLGVALCVVGVAISIWMWRSKRPDAPVSPV